MPPFLSMAEHLNLRGLVPLSDVPALPKEALEAHRKPRLPLHNTPELGFLVDTSLGSKAFVIVSGKPVVNPQSDVTFVFLSGTPGQFFDLLQIGQQIEEHFNVVYIDVLRGWSVTDEKSPLKKKVYTTDLMRLVGESLMRVRRLFGNHVVLAPYSSGNITTLPLVMQNRATLPEIRGIIALNPVLAAFMPKPMTFNLEATLLVKPIIGRIARRLAVSSPKMVMQSVLEMIQGEAPEGFMDQYVRSWGADQNSYSVPTFAMDGEMVTTQVRGGYDKDEFKGVILVENSTMRRLTDYQRKLAPFYHHLSDLEMSVIASANDHTVRSHHDTPQEKPNARGFMVYNSKNGLNEVYEGALAALQKVNAKAELNVFTGGGHGFWNMKDFFKKPDTQASHTSPFLSVFHEMARKLRG